MTAENGRLSGQWSSRRFVEKDRAARSPRETDPGFSRSAPVNGTFDNGQTTPIKERLGLDARRFIDHKRLLSALTIIVDRRTISSLPVPVSPVISTGGVISGKFSRPARVSLSSPMTCQQCFRNPKCPADLGSKLGVLVMQPLLASSSRLFLRASSSSSRAFASRCAP